MNLPVIFVTLVLRLQEILDQVVFTPLCNASKKNEGLFYKKSAFKIFFVKFLGKHLYWSLFYNKVSGWRPPTLPKKTPSQYFLGQCKTTGEKFGPKHLRYINTEDKGHNRNADTSKPIYAVFSIM